MAYSFYHSTRLQGTKMEPLDPAEFVPKWQPLEDEESEEEDDLLQVVPAEKAGLANKVLAVFGLKRS